MKLRVMTVECVASPSNPWPWTVNADVRAPAAPTLAHLCEHTALRHSNRGARPHGPHPQHPHTCVNTQP
eukprot:253623-Chlamydomonas_euryale.AAC.1